MGTAIRRYESDGIFPDSWSNREMNMQQYRKSRAHSPQGFFECEGRGLKWLREAYGHGGPRVVEVFGWGRDYLDIERVNASSPTPKAAHDFGAALARLHDFGAEYFGEPPAGYSGTCYFGPLQDPVPMDTGSWDDVAEYYAQGRLLPMVQMGIDRGALTSADMRMTEEIVDALPDLLGPAAEDKPARVHGDLWSGNVMWTSDGGQSEAVLIDPAAHGGHREEDISMLHLFGMSYLSDIIDGYQTVHPLARGFADRYTLWQLYPIAGHCVFFGGGYVSEYRSMCRSLLSY